MMNDSADFSDIKAVFERKVRQARKFFGNTSAVIAFKGRSLSDAEEAELLDIISRETDLHISSVAAGGDAPAKLNLPPSRKIVRLEHLITVSERALKDTNKNKETIFHRGNLRSGMSIEHRSSVVILGDVNPGGEIIAGGNIVVLGILKGLAHAGAFGDDTSFVAAISMQATQLRIANIITSLAEESVRQKRARRADEPSYAYVADEKIYISPLL
jgi:septum site-determining protein MinC